MVTMNTCSVLLVAAAAVVLAFAPSPATADPVLCTWRTVAHPEDPFIQNLGRWALEQERIVLQFIKVESARAQGVGECTSMSRNYDLIIKAAIHGGGYRYISAVVYVTNFTQPQKVISFSAISPPPSQPPAANLKAAGPVAP